MRVGLILEDADGFAGDIAHRHVHDESLRHVTASVDKITWLQGPPAGLSLPSRMIYTALIAPHDLTRHHSELTDEI